MEKTYQLDQKETGQFAQLDQERTNALANVGALSLDMEQARKNLDSAMERQRAFLRHALNARGVEEYLNARMANGAIVVTVADPTAQPLAMGRVIERPNGQLAEAKE